MTKRDKVGIGFLIAIFLLMSLLLVLAFRSSSGRSHTFDKSPLVRQRIINLQKGD